MILKSLQKYNLKKDESIMVGDGWKDIDAGRNAGIRTVLFKKEYNKDITNKPDYEITKLSELFKLPLWEK